MLNERRDSILCVRGNCDTEVDQMVLQFPILADYAWIAAEGFSIFATHGHVYNTEKLPPLPEGGTDHPEEDLLVGRKKGGIKYTIPVSRRFRNHYSFFSLKSSLFI